jgi:hypothetical protein
LEESLLRNGQKNSMYNLLRIGFINKLVDKAKNNDYCLFYIKNLLELAENISHKPISQKTF